MTMKVIVIGATGGIGRAISMKLAQDGFELALLGRNLSKLTAIQKDISGKISGKKTKLIEVDVRSRASVNKAIQKSVDFLGSVDALIYAAGVSIHGPFQELSEADFDEVIETNLKGTFLCFSSIWEHIRTSKGQIINIASASGFRGYPTGSIYCASKAGVNGLIESITLEGRQQGVRISNISPGQVDTTIWNPNDPEVNKARKDMLSPDSVAELVHFLLNRPRSELISSVLIYPFALQPDLTGKNRGPGGKFCI